MKYFFAFFWLVVSNIALAQNISMEFPAFAGKTYDFVIFQGSRQETVQQDTIPANGKFTLKIPKQYAPYTGMCRWLITGTAEGGGLDMAIPGYDFSVSCMSKTPDNGNINYKGFDAVNELNRLNAKQQVIIDKFEAMSKATQLYDTKHVLFTSFQKEKELQVKAYDAFQQELKQNPNYNARFLPIVNLTKGIPHRLTDDYQQKAFLLNEFITQKVSFEDLYVSGHWQGIIQSWVALQANVINDKAKFAQDFTQISNRIKKPVHYTDFVGKMTYYLTQYGKDAYIEAIAKTVLASGKVSEYLGSMQVYQKSMVGTQAPNLVITQHIGKLADHNHSTTLLKSSELATGDFSQTLLVFYQSGCGPCEVLMQQLPQKYEALKKQGIRIISLSADEGETLYQNSSKDYPWPDKYCDFEGKAGVNFTNYVVKGTPTLILLDKAGKIVYRGATLDDLLQQVGKSLK